MVILETTLGNITIKTNPDKAPISVENFLKYIDDGFFDSTIFHRVIPGFMVQGGGFNAEMENKPTAAAIKNEAKNGLKNNRATLSMARTSEVDSATSQFFINLSDNEFLNHSDRDFGYAVFAEVVDGMDVIDKMATVATGSKGGHQDVPLEPIVIISAKSISAKRKDA